MQHDDDELDENWDQRGILTKSNRQNIFYWPASKTGSQY